MRIDFVAFEVALVPSGPVTVTSTVDPPVPGGAMAGPGRRSAP
ncbi:MAG TPA: hypothetical protein VMU39_09555 [Solirubrobacteraceae bacterium]|nr:hypothetical protein [Solirubrobacteraceae bacterium]